MTYGFKIVQEMAAGLSSYLDEKGMKPVGPRRPRGAQRHRLWQYPEPQLYVAKAPHRPGIRLHKVQGRC